VAAYDERVTLYAPYAMAPTATKVAQAADQLRDNWLASP